MADHIAQSFYIDVPTNIEGVFLTGLDLYFKRKDPTRGVTVELRAVDSLTGQITSDVLPYSTVYVPNASIYTSTTGNVATKIVFDAPVFVQNKTDYAFVIMPEGNSPFVDVWVAKLGEKDLVTGVRVSQQPSSGVMFVSSNSRTWTVIQEEDIKFKLYRAVFSTSTTGNIIFTNDDVNFVTVSSATGYGLVGEQVKGDVRLTLSGISGTISVGHSVKGNVSTANGAVVAISGSVYRVRTSNIAAFTNAETIVGRYANGALSGASATVSSQATPTGVISFRDGSSGDADDYKLHLSQASGTLIVGEQLRGQESNATFTVSSIDDLQMNVADIEIQKLDFTTTQSTWQAKTTSSTDVLATSFYSLEVNDNTEFTSERKIASRSNEITNLSSAKSLQVRGLLKTYSNYLSPIVNANRTHAIIVANIINNDGTGETGVSGGNAWARHITKKVTLADGQDAEDLKLYLTAFWPSSTQIKTYYKILHAEDSDTLDDISWTEMQMANPLVYSLNTNTDDFREYEFKIPSGELTGPNGEVQYQNSNGVTFSGFKYFVFKVVLLSPNTAMIPRLKDLRAIALQL